MKYKLTDDTIDFNGRTLHRIECVEAFGDVKVGEKGGYIEKTDNLSQFGNAWVYGNAKVFDKAFVYDDAKVFGNAWVYGNAKVFNKAFVYDDAKVFGDASVCGNAEVCEDAEVEGNALVYDNSWEYGDASVCGNARVKSNRDYIVFKNSWSSGRYFIWTRSNDMWKVGCFYGTGKELIEKAYKDSDVSGKHYEAYVKFVEQLKELENIDVEHKELNDNKKH